MIKRLSISLVLFENERSDIVRLLESLKLVNENFDLYVIDNSFHDSLKELFINKNVIYEKSESNLGFARAHNIILKRIVNKYKYHLIINPDIFFDQDSISPLIKYMESESEVMQAIPKIYNSDNTIQFTYKFEPRPFDLFARRFLPKSWFQSRKEQLSRKISLNGEIQEIPIMSGCFMFFKTEVLREIGYLDERFFIYMEDIDFSKRISDNFKSIYFPGVHIFHKHTQGSYKHSSLMYRHLISAVKYYNKHGWYPLW